MNVKLIFQIRPPTSHLAGETFRRVVVKSVPAAQQSKELARTMYLDESPVIEKPDFPMFRERGSGRPTKRERRDMEKWRG